MLSKLFKHEWNDTWAVGAVCALCMFVTALMGAIIFSLGAWDKLFESETPMGFAVFGSYFVLLYCVFLGTPVVVRFFFFYRYYKNLYTDQGYLMHTLPAKKSELILSKYFVAIIWNYLMWIAAAICAIILGASFINGVGEEIELSDIMDGFAQVFDTPEFYGFILGVICWCIIVLIYPLLQTIYMYVCVNVGQMFKNGKFILAVVMFIGTGMVVNMFSGFLRIFFLPLLSGYDGDVSSAAFNVSGILVLVLEIGAIIGAYLLVNYLSEKKLNLE